MSLLSYIKTYAPEADANKPVQYANNIAKDLDITPQTPIKDIDAFQLACAHSKYEDHKMFQKLKDLGIVPSSFV